MTEPPEFIWVPITIESSDCLYWCFDNSNLRAKLYKGEITNHYFCRMYYPSGIEDETAHYPTVETAKNVAEIYLCDELQRPQNLPKRTVQDVIAAWRLSL